MNNIIGKYMTLNSYSLSRYIEIAHAEFVGQTTTTIDMSKMTTIATNVSLDEMTTLMKPSKNRKQNINDIMFLNRFTEKQKEIILTFLGYTLAYIIYFNNGIIMDKSKKKAAAEAEKLLRALDTQTINHISFNLTDEKGEQNKSTALTLKDIRTLLKIIDLITPTLKEQITLVENKKDVRIGTEKNSIRKEILISLTPLMRYLKHETPFSEKSWEEIAKWILDFLKTMVVKKYTELQLDDESHFTLVDYERKNRLIKYIMKDI